MRRLRNFWRCIEERADTASPRERWRLAAGPDFDVLERFLVPSGDVVSPVYPCPQCGRDLIVIPLGEAIVAEPDVEAPCQPVEGLSFDDVREFRLNWGAIVRAVGTATGCPLDLDWVRGGCACARGDWVKDLRRITVALHFGETNSVVSEEAVRLISSRGGSLLLTGRHKRDGERLVAGTGCGYAALEDIISVDDEGRMICSCDLTTHLVPMMVSRETGKSAVSKSEWGFVDEGASYRVTMPEGEFTMPKKVGESYLHWFVRNPRQERRALDLVSQVRGTGGKKVMVDWDEEQNVGTGMIKCGENVDGITTQKSLKELHGRLRAIKSERDRAEDEGDTDLMSRLNGEVEEIQRQMDKDTNRFGKIRKVANDDTKASAGITRQLNRAYERLRKVKGHQPARKAFVEHFKQYLSIGYSCKYAAPMERDWRVLGK